MKIFVLGHVSPDLDAMASSVEYAQFLIKTVKYSDIDIVAVRSGEPNKETEFVFEKFGVKIPDSIENYNISDEDIFVLTDHNEESQRHPSVVNERILEIVDHHKININFPSPIKVNIEPLGSTSTIIYQLFKSSNTEPPEKIAGLMLSGLLSDTQGLKASTTTETDRQFAGELSERLKIDLDEFAMELFKAKSDISGLTADEIAKKDYKVFDFGNKKVFINQVETVEPEKVLGMKNELVEKLKSIKSREGLDQAYIAVTDILKINSKIIYPEDTEKAVLTKAFGSECKDNVVDIGQKMSRKKDIAPSIEKAVTA